MLKARSLFYFVLVIGGPLQQGDIEDFDGELRIVCPWHGFEFELKTGKCSGLQVKCIPTKMGNQWFNVALAWCKGF